MDEEADSVYINDVMIYKSENIKHITLVGKLEKLRGKRKPNKPDDEIEVRGD